MKKPKELISKENVQKRVSELADRINNDYKEKTLTVIGVLKGSCIFMMDLIRKLKMPVFIDFIEVQSYGDDQESSGVVKLIKDVTHSIEDQDILIVEDIVDTGLTMNYLVENFKIRNPKSIKICAFLDKPSKRKVSIDIDYNGFTIEDKFVVGYGLDHKGFLRNLSYVGYFE